MTAYQDGPAGHTPLNAANLNRDFNARPAKWAPNTPYVGGGVDLCITPAGDVASRITSGTSPSTFAADAANWALSATYVPKPAGITDGQTVSWNAATSTWVAVTPTPSTAGASAAFAIVLGG